MKKITVFLFASSLLVFASCSKPKSTTDIFADTTKSIDKSLRKAQKSMEKGMKKAERAIEKASEKTGTILENFAEQSEEFIKHLQELISDLKFHETISFSSTRVEKIHTDLTSEDLYIVNYSGSEIILESYCTEDIQTWSARLNGDSLEIKGDTMRRKPKTAIILYYPESKHFSTITTSSTSGDVQLKNVNAEEIRTESTSGDLKAENVVCKNFRSDSTSGDIYGFDVKADSLKTNSTSADLYIKDAACKMVKCSTTSGDITFIAEKEISKDSNFGTNSGDIHITLPESSNLKIKTQTNSGKIINNFEGSSKGFQTADLKVSTTSGNITINSR